MTATAAEPVVALGVPVQPRGPGDAVPFARLAERIRSRRLWLGHSGLLDAQLLVAYFAGMGIRLSYGSSVALTPLAHPYQAALTARSLAVLTGGTYTAGFGPAVPELVSALHGLPYRSPRAAAVEYAEVVRALVAGDRVVDHAGAYFTQRALRPFEPSPRVEVGLGVLRPAMARSAGRVAEAAISWLTPLDYLRGELVPALADGAADAGVRRPRLCTLVQVAVRRPGRDPAELADFASGLHLRAPHYRSMLHRSGMRPPSDPMAAARMLVDHRVFLYGTPEEIADGIAAYHAAGVDEVVVKTTGVQMAEGLRPAVDDAVAVMEAAGQLTGDGSGAGPAAVRARAGVGR